MRLTKKSIYFCRIAAIAAVMLHSMFSSSLDIVRAVLPVKRAIAFSVTTTHVGVSRFTESLQGRRIAVSKKGHHRSMVSADPIQQTLQTYQHRKNLEPLVICGPSGVGKGTIIASLMKRFGSQNDVQNGDADNLGQPFGFCVSHTTRQPRPGEIDGVHYYFTTMEDIQRDIAAEKFVEHAMVHGNYYGTNKLAIERLQQQEKITILDIDMQGVMAVKKSGIPAKYVFIAPPSLEELERRLRGRETETDEAIKIRIGTAEKEIAYGQEAGNFDHIFVNRQIDQTVQEMTNVLKLWYPQLNANLP